MRRTGREQMKSNLMTISIPFPIQIAIFAAFLIDMVRAIEDERMVYFWEVCRIKRSLYGLRVALNVGLVEHIFSDAHKVFTNRLHLIYIIIHVDDFNCAVQNMPDLTTSSNTCRVNMKSPVMTTGLLNTSYEPA